MKNYGYQNEIDFVELFNNKYYEELDDNSKRFLLEIFNGNIDNDEIIKSWKNKVNQKADFFIKYKTRIRGISLKCGRSNSIHHENIQDFKIFLKKLGIPFKIIDYYVSYHYGYARDEYGNTDFSRCLSADEYKSLYQNEIDIFNETINQTKYIIEMVDRFLVRGRNSEIDVDAFIYGKTDDYIWILKNEMYDLILSNSKTDYSSPHIACITLGPKKRNLDYNPDYARERFLVCARWHYFKEDIELFKQNKLRK